MLNRPLAVGVAVGIVAASLFWLSLHAGVFKEKKGESAPARGGVAPARRIALTEAVTAFPAARAHELAAVKLDQAADLLKVNLKADLAGSRKFLAIDVDKAGPILEDYKQCEGMIGVLDSSRGVRPCARGGVPAGIGPENLRDPAVRAMSGGRRA